MLNIIAHCYEHVERKPSSFLVFVRNILSVGARQQQHETWMMLNKNGNSCEVLASEAESSQIKTCFSATTGINNLTSSSYHCMLHSEMTDILCRSKNHSSHLVAYIKESCRLMRKRNHMQVRDLVSAQKLVRSDGVLVGSYTRRSIGVCCGELFASHRLQHPAYSARPFAQIQTSSQSHAQCSMYHTVENSFGSHPIEVTTCDHDTCHRTLSTGPPME